MAEYMDIDDWRADHVTLVLRDVDPRQEIQLLRFHHPSPVVDPGSGFLARTGFNHVCFRVPNLKETLAGFAAIGVVARNDLLEFHDRTLVFVDGPAGVVFELAEWKTARHRCRPGPPAGARGEPGRPR